MSINISDHLPYWRFKIKLDKKKILVQTYYQKKKNLSSKSINQVFQFYLM